MLHAVEVDQRTMERATDGDQVSLERLYGLLWQAFGRQVTAHLRDDQDARSVFHDAFVKFTNHLPQLEWRGVGQLYAYFKRVLESTIVDHVRRERLRVEWERRHLLTTIVESSDGAEEERLELIPGPENVTDPLRREHEAQAWADLLAGLMSALSDGSRRLLEAYQRMTDVPGHQSWPAQTRTGFVKAQVGLADGAFYPAHNRFKNAVLEFLSSHREQIAATGLVHRDRSVRVVRA